MQMAPQTSTKLTYEDYAALPNDGKRYEIFDGELYVNPAPNMKHSLVTGNLYRALWNFVHEHRLGYVFFAPFDVVLSDIDVAEPDVLFVSNERKHLLTKLNLRGAPDLAIEVLSPGTRSYDQTVKFKRYGLLGVAEYWIVDPGEEWVKIYRSTGDAFASVEVSDPITSPLLPGLALPLSEVFATDE